MGGMGQVPPQPDNTKAKFSKLFQDEDEEEDY